MGLDLGLRVAVCFRSPRRCTPVKKCPLFLAALFPVSCGLRREIVPLRLYFVRQTQSSIGRCSQVSYLGQLFSLRTPGADVSSRQRDTAESAAIAWGARPGRCFWPQRRSETGVVGSNPHSLLQHRAAVPCRSFPHHSCSNLVVSGSSSHTSRTEPDR